jgi:hypothetical protein
MKSLVAAACGLGIAGCVVAAAGAGAGGGIYFTQRGVESVVPASLDRTYDATQQAFQQLHVRETKTTAERGGGEEKREVEGAASAREVTVTLTSEGKGSTRVQVIAKKSAVTWDKDFARRLLETIVALSR